MSRAISPAMAELYDQLADGAWHDGPRLLRDVARVIPPGEASRHGARIRTGGQALPAEELVRSGRRDIARTSISNALERDRIQVDVDKMTRDHWAGRLPWRIRDTWAGVLSLAEAADALDITISTLRTWIKHGFCPVTDRGVRGGLLMSPADMEAARAVRAAWPGPNKRFPVDPRTLWGPGLAARQGQTGTPCPYCGEPIIATVSLSKAVSEQGEE